MKAKLTAAALSVLMASAASSGAFAADAAGGPDNFYKSDRVTMEKVSFHNLYKMNVVGNLYLPKNADPAKALPAVVVGHPMGAVKEQSSNLYAQKLAEAGFAALAIDLSFWGESAGEPRQSVLPDVYSDDFSAAVDFLGTKQGIDRTKIGGLGICGSGSFLISAAKIDPRIKAVATVSMYDMGAATRNGLRHGQTLEQRKAVIEQAAEERWKEYETGKITQYTSGTVNELTPQSTAIDREFYGFYRTPRGEFTPASSTKELTTHSTLTSNVKFMNFYPFNDIETISPRPMLFVAGKTRTQSNFPKTPTGSPQNRRNS